MFSSFYSFNFRLSERLLKTSSVSNNVICICVIGAKRSHELTVQVNGNGNIIGVSNPVWEESVPEPGSNSEVITSPKVHGVFVLIFTWYSFRHTRKRGWHGPEHWEFGPEEPPSQHFPLSSFPASLSNDNSRNSKTPLHSAYDNQCKSCSFIRDNVCFELTCWGSFWTWKFYAKERHKPLTKYQRISLPCTLLNNVRLKWVLCKTR